MFSPVAKASSARGQGTASLSAHLSFHKIVIGLRPLPSASPRQRPASTPSPSAMARPPPAPSRWASAPRPPTTAPPSATAPSPPGTDCDRRIGPGARRRSANSSGVGRRRDRHRGNQMAFGTASSTYRMPQHHLRAASLAAQSGPTSFVTPPTPTATGGRRSFSPHGCAEYQPISPNVTALQAQVRTRTRSAAGIAAAAAISSIPVVLTPGRPLSRSAAATIATRARRASASPIALT